MSPPERRAGVFVLAGPTSVGKGTVVNRLRELHPEIFVSVSATTRAPRPGEVEGVHYHFVSEQTFDTLIATEGLLEWAVVHGAARYGTPREPVERAVAQGRTVLLEIDLQGARQVRTSYPQARQIFLAPPSWDELVRRLVGRGTETPEQQHRRLATAREELAAAEEFDEIVVNGEIDETVARLVELLSL
ncbi:guanylate kinase [Aestuariimicrobium ganziense]|uniref:guanylate kinase n=1 Tax=Aestuariimicrobium ganziense TaxID=2773677 RepID=UPI002E29313B|nr:guanylate kinase [Aestuariimicrobium ganziense]